MRLRQSVVALAIALKMAVPGCAWALCAASALGSGDPAAKGQVIERVAVPSACLHRDVSARGRDAAKPAAVANEPRKLPPIASLKAGSDLRAFLAPNVPADLKRAALRRAWSTDPDIRDFVGLTEDLPDMKSAPAGLLGSAM
jgi:hypothetical protein